VEIDIKVSDQGRLDDKVDSRVVLLSKELTPVVVKLPVQDEVENNSDSVVVTEVEQLTLKSGGDSVSSTKNDVVEADSVENIS